MSKYTEDQIVEISKFDAYAFWGMIDSLIFLIETGDKAKLTRLTNRSNLEALKKMKLDLEKSLDPKLLT